MQNKVLSKHIAKILMYFVLLLQSSIVIVPIFMMINSSLKKGRDIFKNPFGLPQPVTFDNFRKLFVDNNYVVYFRNSLVVTIVSLLFIVMVTSLASYAIAKYKFKANKYVYMFFIFGLMIPIRLGTINLMQLFINLNLYDTHWALIAIYSAMGIPAGILILTGFIKEIPEELSDAGRIDGYSETMIFIKIILPIVSAGIVVVVVYDLMPIWNDFWFPLILLSTDKLMTVPLITARLFGQHETDFGLLYGILTAAAVPPIIMFIALSKYFIKGLTAGAVKG